MNNADTNLLFYNELYEYSMIEDRRTQKRGRKVAFMHSSSLSLFILVFAEKWIEIYMHVDIRFVISELTDHDSN